MKNRWILLFLSLFLLVGCQKPKEENKVFESKAPFTVEVFYIPTCPICKQLREQFLTRVKEEFQEQVTIIEYNIDEEENLKLYYSYMGLYDHENDHWKIEGKLKDVPKDIHCDELGENCQDYSLPFVVVGEFYAFLGYDETLLEDYVQDIHLALQFRSLSRGQVSLWRWEFQ